MTELETLPKDRETLIKRLQGMDALQIFLETCHEDDKENIKNLIDFVHKLGQMAPRGETTDAIVILIIFKLINLFYRNFG